MVYGVCNAETGYHSQAYSAELQHYYAQCQGQEAVQTQTYLSPSLSQVDSHRSQGPIPLQDSHVGVSYTNLDDYNGYGQHLSQHPYDYSGAVQAGQLNTACTPPTTHTYAGYLDPATQYRHMSMGIYTHHDGVREACSMTAMMGSSPHCLPHHQPQQSVPTYKWMQVKRNVPKPGKIIAIKHSLLLIRKEMNMYNMS